MRQRFILFKRGEVFYGEDTTTGKQSSLHTRDRAEAGRLLNTKNEAERQPAINLQIARAYLAASDPQIAARTWQHVMDEATRLDESIAPVCSFYGPSGLVLSLLQSKCGVRRYHQHSGRLHREFVLLRFALSLTASLPYLPPAFQYTEDRLGKHNVAVSSELSALIKIPTGPGVFRFAAFEDVAHTVKQWAVKRYARHPATKSFPNSHEGETGGCGQRMWRQTRD